MNFNSKIFFSGNERSVTVKKNIVASFAIKGISISISLLLVPVTIGYVSPELYGVWLVLSSVLLWIQFLDLGFSQGLKNKLTEAIAFKDWKKGKSIVTMTYVMVAMIFIPAGIVLELIAPEINWCNLLNINTIYAGEIVRVLHVMIAFLCIQMIVNVLTSVLAAFQKVAFSSLFAVIGQVLAFIIIVILTKTTPPSLMGLALSYSIMPVVVIIIASIILYSKRYKQIAPDFKSFDKALIKDLFGLGYKFFIINVQVVVLYQTTNILISNVSSPLQVTSYNIAYKYLNVAMMAYTIITAPLWPAYTDAYVKKDFAWMKKVRNKMIRILFLSFAVLSVMVAMSSIVYDVWIGSKANVPFLMTCMVALYVIAYGWMNVNGTFIVGMGKIRIDTIISVIGMIVHIPLSLYLSKYIGAYGVVTSMILINLFYAFVFHIQVNKILSNKAVGIWLE